MTVFNPEEEFAMHDTGQIVMVAVGSVGAVIGLVLGTVLCSWCFGKKKKIDEDEEVFGKKYKDEESGKIPPSALRKGGTPGSPALTRKTIKGWFSLFDQQEAAAACARQPKEFERPDRKMVAEHVQPSANSQTALNQSLGIGQVPRESYQTMGITRGMSLSSQSRSASEEEGESSVWKGVRSFATMLMDDSPQEENNVPVVEGIDYKLGRISFGVGYDFQNLTLTLKIVRALGLPAKDLSGTSDPYVKIMMLPDKKHKLLTKVKKKNLNPHWNECFLFEGWPHNKLLEKTLYLQVIDYDRFSRDDPIGETYVPLNSVDLSNFTMTWKHLQPCKDSRGKLGELLVSLCYQPNIGRLTIVIMKARDLKIKDITGSSDPYVKVWLIQGGQKVEKKKTIIKKRSLNPVYNESFIFDIPWEKMRETSLEVSVMDFDKLGRNELIGKVILGAHSGPMETRHWNDMISKPRQQVAQWHLLKD